MSNTSEIRQDTVDRRNIRFGLYGLISALVLLVLFLPVGSPPYDAIPFLPSMQEDSFAFRLLAAVAVALSIICYMAPTIVAYRRWHNKILYIFLANLILGWSGIIWIVMLVWSLGEDRTRPVSAKGELDELTRSRLSIVRSFSFISTFVLVCIVIVMVLISLTGNDPREGTPDAKSEITDSTSSRSE